MRGDLEWRTCWHCHLRLSWEGLVQCTRCMACMAPPPEAHMCTAQCCCHVARGWERMHVYMYGFALVGVVCRSCCHGQHWTDGIHRAC